MKNILGVGLVLTAALGGVAAYNLYKNKKQIKNKLDDTPEIKDEESFNTIEDTSLDEINKITEDNE